MSHTRAQTHANSKGGQITVEEDLEYDQIVNSIEKDLSN